MNVSGKITMFVEFKEGQNGSYQKFSGSISHKHEDNTYTNCKIELVFDKDFKAKDKLKELKAKTAYQLDVKEGWLDANAWEYEGKMQYRILIHIKDATIVSTKEVKENSNGLPF